jgi:hypothetical protein
LKAADRQTVLVLYSLEQILDVKKSLVLARRAKAPGTANRLATTEGVAASKSVSIAMDAARTDC